MLSISDRFEEYAVSVYRQLIKHGVRVALDVRSEKVGYKIREAQAQKVPYMLVVGSREVESTTVRVRHRSAGDLGAMTVAAFVDRIQTESRHALNGA